MDEWVGGWVGGWVVGRSVRFVHSFLPPFFRSFIRSVVCSLAQRLAFVRSVGVCRCAFVLSPFHSFLPSFLPSFLRSFLRSFFRWLAPSSERHERLQQTTQRNLLGQCLTPRAYLLSGTCHDFPVQSVAHCICLATADDTRTGTGSRREVDR